jgi:hypothetical protein
MGGRLTSYWCSRNLWAIVIFPLVGAVLLAVVGIFKGWLHQRVGFDSEGHRLANPPAASQTLKAREPLASVVIYRSILEDLQRRDVEARPRLRYLTLLHRYNNPDCSDADLDAERLAVRDMTSILCHGKSSRADFIDPHQLVFRIDLEDLDWAAETEWHQVISYYRYGLGGEGADTEAKLRRQVEELTEDPIPVVRADWLVVALALPPLSGPGGLLRVANDDLPESIRTHARRYAGQTLDLACCARELDLSDPKTLSALIRQQDHLQHEFGLAPLLKGESIRREWWESERNFFSPYQELARLMKLGKPVRVQ